MTKKVLIIGNGAINSALLIADMKQKYGDDVELITDEQAREQGIPVSDFANTDPWKIAAPPIPIMPYEPKSGQESRRERRARERRNR